MKETLLVVLKALSLVVSTAVVKALSLVVNLVDLKEVNVVEPRVLTTVSMTVAVMGHQWEAYLVALNLSSRAKRTAAMSELVARKQLYFRAGQVRSLPFPYVWTRCNFSPNGRGCRESKCSGCPGNGTYQ